MAGFFSLTHAQQIQVTGKVTDSLQNPLVYANILAIFRVFTANTLRTQSNVLFELCE